MLSVYLPCDPAVTGRDLVLLANAVKNYRSANLLACKQGLLVIYSHGREQAGLVEVGMGKGIGLGQSWVRAAKGQGGKCPCGQR